MGYVKGLKCKECQREFPKDPIHVCEYCFGPLEVDYDYEAIGKVISRKRIQDGPPSMWRYKDLMPLDEEPKVGHHVGYTPLVRAKNLGKALGLKNLYVKNDSVNHPTFSFKDRVVCVAISKAMEFGFDMISCASTGNLANSVAAHSAEAGLKSCIFIPDGLEAGKILGTNIYGTQLIAVHGSYDDVNRLCSEIAANHRWAFVNINIRPYYGDGSRSYGYEIAEQLGWKTPDNVVVPVAGSSLITKIYKAFKEFEQFGLLEGKVNTKVFAAQATGCSPVTTAIKNGTETIKPVKPNTIAKSIAIGNPADGYYGVKTAKNSGGWGEDVSDEEVVKGMQLLAQTEGIFTETAGGVTVGVTKKLVEQGRIKPDEVTVICVTGNGLKTQEALAGVYAAPPVIEPKLQSFEDIYSNSITV
ncbi:MAG: threonine synthase [Candidatus Nitrohelix vancouverensis]|uniref:Threonine synthase n=1 Tax=Candidatus Nitrohelix vancouverensis TaxID=2705534 RepID=A0A7T0C4E8_9BACT|nr:MAG: threonine synthase [Candidatus Nitrohelix vancouverensis]